MQELNWKKIQLLNGALNSTEVVEVQGQQTNKSVLKSGKDLSGETYLKVASVKKKLRNAVDDVAEKEKEVFEHNDYVLQGSQWTAPIIDNTDKEELKRQRDKAKEISQKLDTVHNEIKIEIPDAFIPKQEFLQWTKECSNEVSSILAEFLLVGFDKD